MKKFLVITVCALAAVMLLSSAALAAKKVVRIGTEGAYPPFNFVDEKGQLQGFDIDIAKALCEKMDVTCEFVVQDWDGLIPALLAKKFDAIVASMSMTEERQQKVDFTDKYYQTPAKFVAPKNIKADVTKEGLKGKVIGVQRATIHENFIRDNYGDVAEIKAYAKQEEANMDLVSGRVDYVFADTVVLQGGFLDTPDGKDYHFVGPAHTEEQWFGAGIGIAVRKGEPDLVKAFNKAIKDIRADGTYQKINAKYFDFDLYGD